MKLTAEHLAILRTLGSSGRAKAAAIRDAAFPPDDQPTIHGVLCRLDTLVDRRLVSWSITGGAYVYTLTDAGRTALSAKEAE